MDRKVTVEKGPYVLVLVWGMAWDRGDGYGSALDMVVTPLG